MRGLVECKLVKAPSNFIAGCPKAALLFWFFCDFRCGVPLFFLYINIEIGKKKMINISLVGDHLYGK